MKKLTGLLIAILGFTTISFAQQKNGKVTGQVIDGSSKIIEAATISLLRAGDSSVAKISVADKQGKFVFEAIADGRYMVSISAVGHVKAYSEVFEINEAQKGISIKTIELIPVSKSLNAVTVVSRKPLIEQKIDRTIVNVEAAVTNVGASALDVLEKSPGISIDKDGNISLKGKQGVQVYIDGRPSYLSGTDLATYLRNLTSAQLEQIEIMTNPPAKYDAAGNSGIINIKTKKNKQLGYNGSINLGYGQGRLPKFNESVNFNYRKNKINLFANIGYSNRKNWQDLDIQRKFIDKSTKVLISNFDQNSRIKENGESINAKVGLDYYATQKTTLGIVLNGFNNPGKFSNRSDVYISNPSNVLTNITKAATNNDRKWKNFGANLNLRHVFDSTGKELTADLDYLGYKSTNAQDLVNAYYNAVGQPTDIPDTLLGSLPQDINIYSAKMDYSQPLKKGAKFEAGVKTSFVKTDNDARYDSLLNNQKVLDRGRSNHFVYNENVNAAYVNYSRPFGKKISAQFGLRVENTNIKGRSTGLVYRNNNWVAFDSTFNRHYTQLFPTVFFQYNADKKNTFGLNYGRRIERPDYEDLNPFILFLDRYTFQQGNPGLLPQFSHNIELSHTYKGFLTTTLNYTNTTDIINDVLEQNTSASETFVKKANIAKQRQYGIAVAAGFSVKKWWSMNVYGNVYNNQYSGIINGDFVKTNATTGQFNVGNQFKFNKGWASEVSGFYRTSGIEGVFAIRGFGMMNLGVSKQMMKGKGSVRLNVRDVLWSQKIKGNIRYSNIDAAFQQQRDSRVFNIGFTYRFNKGKVGQKRKVGGAGDEQSRVKAGNEN
ncbi:MAG: TonB-dependent receptor [Sphingobacteriales bacterium]|nr:TonB-dependent receptor [Sphingobacteriales bacterium]